MLTLLTAIIFYLIGRYSHATPEQEQTIIKAVKNKLPHPDKLKPGVIPFLTPEQREDIKSGDKALEKHWLKSGISKLINP